jgi:GntR family transcriptional regulator/MocR family aminotransferase
VSRSNSEAQKQTNGFPADILVGLDRAQPRGLREQLERELRGAIQDGRISAGTRLPPSRTLADDLGVARSVVVEAYGHLVADGYLEARQGSATRVLPVATSAPPAASPDAGPTPTARFIGGLPDPAYFPRLEWQRHYRAALTACRTPSSATPAHSVPCRCGRRSRAIWAECAVSSRLRPM